ncbi:J domain-containing protein [Pseudonocardia nantongensis]|uniref:J domain-containing protein n=1 Tax=Pseudonocardia nantongensis TaxID=1181885 RepID=UPI00397D0D29
MLVPERDLYADLGVGRGATPEQLRRAYRVLARRLHPDLNPAPDASHRFAQVAAAYAVLADPDLRADYDAARADAAPGEDRSAAAAAAPAAGAYDDYAPVGEPMPYDDYTPVTDDATDLPPQPPAPPSPAPPRPAASPSWAAGRYVRPPRAPFPAGWPAGRVDHRRRVGRLLLTVWRLAPLPASRVGLVVTVLATVAVAYIAAASRQTMPVEATVVGALATVGLACWSVRAVVWAVLHTRARRAVKETR